LKNAARDFFVGENARPALFLFAAERKDNGVHDKCRHHQEVAGMRAE
jgi:hypothetical protein